MMQQFLQDLRFSLRMMRKRPVFFLVVILTLSLGIGANSAIFSVVNGVVLRPLNYGNPDRILTILESRESEGHVTWARIANYLDWRGKNKVFEHLGQYKPTKFTLSGKDGPEIINGAMTSANFFQVLGKEPSLGRGFLPGEDQPGADPVVVLSDQFCRSYFGSIQDVIGRTLTLNTGVHTIIGVMPPGFQFSFRGEQKIWTPKIFSDEERANRRAPLIIAIGRLKPGVSLQQARMDMNRVTTELERSYPLEDEGWGVSLTPLQDQLVGDIRPSLLMLLAGVTVVLLIACVNVINLLLAHNTARESEFALRVALGAGRGRLIRHFLTECLVLTFLGAIGGILFVELSTKALTAFHSGSIPRLDEVGIDVRVLGFTLVISSIVTLVFGMVLSLKAFRIDFVDKIKQGAVKMGNGAGRPLKLRNLAVTLETALVLSLLVCGGLVLKSYWLLHQVDPGFERDRRFALEIPLPNEKYPEPRTINQFFGPVLEKTNALPGVKRAALTTHLPFSEYRFGAAYTITREVSDSNRHRAFFDFVSPDYFQVMGIPLISGRPFFESDREDSTEVVIVNQELARKHWPGEDPVGKEIYLGTDPLKIVGVVGNVKFRGLDVESAPRFYRPILQIPVSYPSRKLVVWTHTDDPTDIISSIRKILLERDKEQPIASILMFKDMIPDSIARHRFNMLLFVCFALVGLLMGGVGVYGVVSYSVGQRVRDMGIRLALGAQRSNVVKLILGTELTPVSVGVVFGIGIAFALARSMSSLLYGVSSTDLSLYFGVTCILLLVALLAIYIPAFKASRVDPITAVRYE